MADQAQKPGRVRGRGAIRWVPTQTGEFMGLPPSGKRYAIPEIHILRVRDGRIVEHWHQFDQLGMMRQLGAMPGPS